VSATGRSVVRHKDDFYETPAWAVEALINHLSPYHYGQGGGTILEPGCGKGAILNALQDSGRFGSHNLRGIELNPYRARVARVRHQVRCADFLKSPWTLSADMVVMNPPYKLALRFAQVSIEVVKKTSGSVHALLRLGFLASAKRRDFWQHNPADVLVLSRRPSFCHVFTCKTCDAKRTRPRSVASMRCPKCRKKMGLTTTDAADYGWFSWGPGPRGRITVV